jgi:hypothetical protein
MNPHLRQGDEESQGGPLPISTLLSQLMFIDSFYQGCESGSGSMVKKNGKNALFLNFLNIFIAKR